MRRQAAGPGRPDAAAPLVDPCKENARAASLRTVEREAGRTAARERGTAAQAGTEAQEKPRQAGHRRDPLRALEAHRRLGERLVLFLAVAVGVLFAGSRRRDRRGRDRRGRRRLRDEPDRGRGVPGREVRGASRRSRSSSPSPGSRSGRPGRRRGRGRLEPLRRRGPATRATGRCRSAGIKRLALRLSGADVDPAAEVYEPALAARLDAIAQGLRPRRPQRGDRAERPRPGARRAREGRALNRREAGDAIVARARALRARAARAARRGRSAQGDERGARAGPRAGPRRSSPRSVRFGWTNAHWVVRPEQMAELLRLPANGRVRAPGRRPRGEPLLQRPRPRRSTASRGRRRLQASPRTSVHVRVVPSGAGRELDAAATAKALLAGAPLARSDREASLVVVESPPR